MTESWDGAAVTCWDAEFGADPEGRARPGQRLGRWHTMWTAVPDHPDHPLDAAWTCRTCGTEVRTPDVDLEIRSPGWDRQGPVRPPGG